MKRYCCEPVVCWLCCRNVYVIEGVESVDCGPVRPLAAVLLEPLVRGKVKDDDAWSKHSRVVRYRWQLLVSSV